MTRDSAELQRWYRGAMADRAAELCGLRPRLESGNPAACDAARRVGMALRGSGATFGFPHISDLAHLLETARDEAVLRQVEGMVAELRAVADDTEVRSTADEWLPRAAGLEPTSAGGVSRDGMAGLWVEVASRSGLDMGELTMRVAGYLGVEVADLGAPDLGAAGRAALRLVPESLVWSARVVPLRESSRVITVAVADPTDLRLQHALRRLTGRSAAFQVSPPHLVDALLEDLVGHPAPSPPPGPGATWISTVEAPGAVDGAQASAPVSALVVDDEADARLIIRSLLQGRGYGVTEAGDGEEALARLQDADFDIVVADLEMPGMDGLELIWALRDREGRYAPPVIVVTGQTDRILETQLLEEGASDYVRKPVDPRLFLARVESALRRIRA